MTPAIPRIVWLFLGLTVALVSGCRHIKQEAGSYSGSTVPASLAMDFDYVRSPNPIYRVEIVERKSKVTIKRIRLIDATQSDGASSNRWIEFDYYDLTREERTPVVMVLPSLGGGYALERHFANYFVAHGYAAVIVRRDIRTKKARPEDLNQLFREMVISHRQVIDWLETQEDVDTERLGVFGVSMGGIKGALLVPLEDRISAAALGLTGGDLPYILTHTTEPGLIRRRERELKERNITLKECEVQLRQMLKYDPIYYASYVDPSKVLLVLARYDKVVPIEKGKELRKKMGDPETIFLPAGHYSAVLSIPYIKGESLEFFDKRFAENLGRGSQASVETGGPSDAIQSAPE